MATNLQVNNIDLDDIFKPLYTVKRADVGYQVSGVDISNNYEPTKNSYDQSSTDTKLYTNGTDLRYVFQDKNYYNVDRIGILTTTERYEKYYQANDGTMTVYVYPLYNKIVNGYASIKVTVGGSSLTKTIYVGTTPPTTLPTTIDFYFTGLDGGVNSAPGLIYGVTVQDLYSNVSRRVDGIVVSYNGSSILYNFY